MEKEEKHIQRERLRREEERKKRKAEKEAKEQSDKLWLKGYLQGHGFQPKQLGSMSLKTLTEHKDEIRRQIREGKRKEVEFQPYLTKKKRRPTPKVSKPAPTLAQEEEETQEAEEEEPPVKKATPTPINPGIHPSITERINRARRLNSYIVEDGSVTLTFMSGSPRVYTSAEILDMPRAVLNQLLTMLDKNQYLLTDVERRLMHQLTRLLDIEEGNNMHPTPQGHLPVISSWGYDGDSRQYFVLRRRSSREIHSIESLLQLSRFDTARMALLEPFNTAHNPIVEYLKEVMGELHATEERINLKAAANKVKKETVDPAPPSIVKGRRKTVAKRKRHGRGRERVIAQINEQEKEQSSEDDQEKGNQ